MAKLTRSEQVALILDKLEFVRIEGQLCYFTGKYFHPINSQTEVESLIYNYIPEISQSASLSSISECARIIFRLHKFWDIEPLENYGFLGVNDGIYSFHRDDGQFSSFVEHPCGADTPIRNEKSDDMRGERDWATRGIYSRQILNSEMDAGLTHILNVEYGPSSLTDEDAIYSTLLERLSKDTPETDKFIRQIAGNNPLIIDRIWEMIACILVPDPAVKAFFFLHGNSNTGKSVLGRFIASFFYRHNVSSLDLTQLGDRSIASILPGTYLNVSMDLQNKQIPAKSIAMLKMLTGDDEIAVEPKYQEVRSFRNRCRFIFASNFPPILSEFDDAFIKRLVMIPFRHEIAKKDQDPMLLSKLKSERNAVAKKAIRYYYPKIKQKNFEFSGAGQPEFEISVIYPDKQQVDQSNQILRFASEKCFITGKPEQFEYSNNLYTAYTSYCLQYDNSVLCSQAQFVRTLQKLYPGKVTRDRRREKDSCINNRGYAGIALLTEPMIFKQGNNSIVFTDI